MSFLGYYNIYMCVYAPKIDKGMNFFFGRAAPSPNCAMYLNSFYLNLIIIMLFIFDCRMETLSWIAILGANVLRTGYWAPNLMDVVNGYLENVVQRLNSSLSIILLWIRRLIQGILIRIKGGAIDIPLWSKENSNNQ